MSLHYLYEFDGEFILVCYRGVIGQTIKQHHEVGFQPFSYQGTLFTGIWHLSHGRSFYEN